VAEGRSLGQVLGEETHQRPALAASSTAEPGPSEERGGFRRDAPASDPSSLVFRSGARGLLRGCFLAALSVVVVLELPEERRVSAPLP